MTVLRQRMIEDLQLRGLALRTGEPYVATGGATGQVPPPIYGRDRRGPPNDQHSQPRRRGEATATEVAPIEYAFKRPENYYPAVPGFWPRLQAV
jgi:hypothetical protein